MANPGKPFVVSFDDHVHRVRARTRLAVETRPMLMFEAPTSFGTHPMSRGGILPFVRWTCCQTAIAATKSPCAIDAEHVT